jgi:hypothetical protein
LKYIPDYGLFFVHVPKCAGTSLQKALDLEEARYTEFAADLGLSEGEAARLTLSSRHQGDGEVKRQGGYVHPKLGPIHPVHLPLNYIEAEMPQTWAALRDAPYSFAVTREPRSRFLSALMQRMREFGDHEALRVDDPRVRDEAARVCDWLAARDMFCDREYIHFTRQIDFAELDGTRIIKAHFPMERTAALSRWIADQTGLQIEIPETHARRQPKRWGKMVQPAARFVGRTLMPKQLRKALHPIWMGSGAFTNAKSAYSTVDLGADVEGFAATYYARDAALHAEAQVRVEALQNAAQKTG